MAYTVCRRRGLTSASESYFANYVRDNMTVNNIDVYRVMRAAGQVEALPGLAEHSRFEKREGARRTRNGHLFGLPEQWSSRGF